MVDNMQAELKKHKRENRILNEKIKNLESELQLASRKMSKYKNIARNFKNTIE